MVYFLRKISNSHCEEVYIGVFCFHGKQGSNNWRNKEIENYDVKLKFVKWKLIKLDDTPEFSFPQAKV